MLPQMIPLRLRNQSEFGSPRAQLQYTPFRVTEFSPRDDDESEGNRAGPGALFHDEWNSMAGNAHKRALSLYRTERDVNPTVETTVQRFYDVHAAYDLAVQMKKRGNVVSTLKSASPRFHAPASETTGPGAYSPERFYGAFPQLLERASPTAAMREKQRERVSFETEFAIGGVSTFESPRGNIDLSPRKSSHHPPIGKPHPSALHTIASPTHSMQQQQLDDKGTESLDLPMQSVRLTVALTPRNAYSSANRQLVLAKGAHYQVRSASN